MDKTVDDMKIRPATAADLADVQALLVTCALPLEGVDSHIATFLVARDGDRLAACSGSEPHHFAALIRSVAVDPEYRGIGLGRRMVREMLDRLASRGLREFYLLTESAEEFFRRRGFKAIDRDEVHPQLLGSSEFEVCPESAVCMRLVMN